MQQLYYLIIGALSLILSNNLTAQQMYVSQEWQSATGSVGTINRTVSTVDSGYNLIVVSNTTAPGNTTDVLITKYDRQGLLLWQQTFNGSGNGNDYGVQVKLNSANEIFVAAAIQGSSSIDFGLLKYATDGTLLWSSSWNSPNDAIDVPADLDIDNSGNIYLVGAAQSSNLFLDYAIVKFNSTGTQLWNTTYDYANLHDAATSLKVDANSIVVTGASASTPSNWDYATLQIQSSTGNILSEQRTVVAGVGLDNAVAVTSDNDNNVYVTGYVEVNGARNIQTVKINGDFGLEWVKTFDGGLDDVAKAIGVDDFGNVYITGHTQKPTGNSYVTIKYDANGTEEWVKEYGDLVGADDAKSEKIAVSGSGNVIITGSVEKDGEKTFTTIQYDQDGNTKFVKEYNSGNGDDKAETISVKGEDVYVSGTTTQNGVKTVSTVKYTVKEKIVNFVVDGDGNPMFEANDLIVRLDTSALKHDAINRKNYDVGKLESFLRPDAVVEIRAALTSICGSDKCDVTVYKIFRQLKTTHNTTTSRLGETIRIPNFWATLLFEFPDGVDITQAANDLDALFPLVKYVDPNVVATLSEDANDTDYGDQHSIHPTDLYPNAHINIEPAWDFENGKPFVKVGVFDTGIDWDHEDFGDGTADGSKVIDGWHFGNDTPLKDNATGDDHSHGTNCSGIIGAIRNNNTGVAGIAGGNDITGTNLDSSGVSLYGMKIFTSTGGFYNTNLTYISNAIITSAIDNDTLDYGFGLHLMSNSWGIHDGFTFLYIDTNLTLLTEATHFVNRANVTFVSSIGNEGDDQPASNNFKYPAVIDDDWILCVGGTGLNGDYKTSTNGDNWFTPSRSWSIDVSAAAATILTKTTNNDGNYTNFNGVSSATPHISGSAALLMSYLNSPNSSFGNLAPEDVEYILQMTATDCDTILHLGVDSLTGFGRVNAGLALSVVDKSKFHLTHFTSDVSPSSISTTLISSGDVIQLSERYQNLFDQWFIEGVDYHVNTYQVNATVNHNLAPLDTIVAYWPRHSASFGFPMFDSDNVLLPRERILIDNLDENNASLTSYFYEVSDSDDNYLGWWPYDPFLIDPDFDYTILHYDPLIPNSIEEFEIGTTVSLYPNPSSNIQTLSFDVDNSADLIIGLYDLRGRLVMDVFNGRLQSGNSKISVSVKDFETGVYVYSILLNNKTKQIKTIIQ